jgi:hypothetical protein
MRIGYTTLKLSIMEEPGKAFPSVEFSEFEDHPLGDSESANP